MRGLSITFEYDGITLPSDGSELTDYAAYLQWQREFLSVVPLLYPLPVFGYAFVGRDLDRGRETVRLIVGDEVTNEGLVAAIQEHLYDAGGLSGGFRIGTIRPYTVKYLMLCTEEVWAYSDEEAKVRADRLVARCEATLVSVTGSTQGGAE